MFSKTAPATVCSPEDWAFSYGAERLGALTVPAAAGNSKRQIKFITDFKTTALHAIPSYAIRLAEVFQEEWYRPYQYKLENACYRCRTPHRRATQKD